MTKRQSELFPELPSDKKYVSDYPELVAEWHPTKNGNLLPDEFHVGSHEKVWWKCSKGHEWQTELRMRTRRGTGCPKCSGVIASSDYNIGKSRPDLVVEWNYNRNKTKPEDHTPNSGKKIWWRCALGHEWEATIDQRNRKGEGRGCPYCASKLASPENNLEIARPDDAKQWDIEKNKGLFPSQVLAQSNKLAWWLCDKGHSYQSTIASKTSSVAESAGCPYCSNKVANEENNLAVKFPSLKKEWHSKNEKKPEEYVPGSNEKVWWICKRKHEWKTSIAHRSLSGRGCPYCTNQSSRNELRIFAELSFITGDTAHRPKIGKYEYDIVLEAQKVAIEYDGSYWHEAKEDLDVIKTEFAEESGYRILRVRETPLNKVRSEDIIIEKSSLISKEQMNDVVSFIFPNSNCLDDYSSHKEFLNEDGYLELLEAVPSPQYENSFAASGSNILTEWHPSKNGALTPKDFGPSSTFLAWWQCKNGHEWQAKIVARNKQGSFCKACKSIITTHPKIAEMFHQKLNKDIDIIDVTYGSHKKYVWQCLKNPNHSWLRSAKSMCDDRAKASCPHCRKEKPSK
jgi:hypothetical protein